MAIVIETDMFYKDVDAHRYLNYGCCQPKFTFSLVVNCQFLRIRSGTFRIYTIQNVSVFNRDASRSS